MRFDTSYVRSLWCAIRGSNPFPALLARSEMRFARYLAAGALATGFHYAVLVAGAEALGLLPWAAAAAGACGGTFVAYAANRCFTFRSRRAHASSLPRFACVAILSGVLNAALVWAGAALFGWHYLAAQLAATALLLVAGYHAHRVWTFV